MKHYEVDYKRNIKVLSKTEKTTSPGFEFSKHSITIQCTPS